MGPNPDGINSVGDFHPRQAAGKGLLIDMRMKKSPGAQNTVVSTQNVSLVDVMFPVLIAVRHCDIKPVAAIPKIFNFDSNNLGFFCVCEHN